MQNYSVLPLARSVRDLPIALAHSLAAAKPGEARLIVLNSLYRDLSPADQLRCRAELHECRRAKRGEIAEIWVTWSKEERPVP